MTLIRLTGLAAFIACFLLCSCMKANAVAEGMDGGRSTATIRRTCRSNEFGPDCIGAGIQKALEGLSRTPSSTAAVASADGGHSRAVPRVCNVFDSADAAQWRRHPGAPRTSKLDSLLLEQSGTFTGPSGADPALGPVQIDFIAQAADDRMVVVLRSPWTNAPFNAVRVFFGPLNALEEPAVIDFQTARDGGTTEVKFRVGATDALAYFPVYCTAEGGELPPANQWKSGDVHMLRRGCVGRLTVDGNIGELWSLPRDRATLKTLKRARFLCAR